MEDLQRQEGCAPDQAAVAAPDNCEATLRAWTLTGDRVALELDLSIYSTEAILRAAYKLTDRCYVFLARVQQPDRLVAVLALKKATTPEALRTLVGEFSNEVIDQRIRESLASEFSSIQTLIIAQAFSEANLLDPGRDEADHRTDSRGIRQRR
jgi:His-Xaa-Ser system protein HxsD